MQDALGHLNDVVVAERIARDLARPGKGRRGAVDYEIAFAAGSLAERRELQAPAILKKAVKAYGAFAEAKPA